MKLRGWLFLDNAVVQASWCGLSISPPFCLVLELPDDVLPPVAIPAVRGELTCLILLSISYTGKERGDEKGYRDENPGWRTWAGLCCSISFPLQSRISPTWSLKMLLWVAWPQTTVIIVSKSSVSVICFDLLLAAWSLGCKPEVWVSVFETAPWAAFQKKIIYSQRYFLWHYRKGLGLLLLH